KERLLHPVLRVLHRPEYPVAVEVKPPQVGSGQLGKRSLVAGLGLLEQGPGGVGFEMRIGHEHIVAPDRPIRNRLRPCLHTWGAAAARPAARPRRGSWAIRSGTLWRSTSGRSGSAGSIVSRS